MCGISGRFNFRSQAPVAAELVRAMTRTLVHRGPDDEGHHIDGSLGLGFRRLSILDLSGGHQPMSDGEQTVWTVFNGEIYNFVELREQLESHGHRFRTRSDTEVILHGYKQWGEGVFPRLNGMFGLALWDVRNRKLILARDAMGIKPLYYEIENGSVTFASEIRAILAVRNERASVDREALARFLRYRYTPAPLTLYRGIRKLAAGTMIVFADGESRVRRWYDVEPEPFSPAKTDADAAEELLDLYRTAIRRQLRSDVPVGLLLSAGADSGLLLKLMSETGSGWPAYTVGYGASFAEDELEEAARTAAEFGARHTAVELDRAAFEQSLRDVVNHLEEPVATSSIVPMYHLSRRVREDVKVALIGQGPDELFGGYTRHLGVRYGAYWRMLPGPLRTAVSGAVRRFPRSPALKRGVNSLALRSRLERHARVFSIVPDEVVDGLLGEAPHPGFNEPDIPELWNEIEALAGKVGELCAFQMIEVRSALPDELLLFCDKMSMAHGLEVRVPFLDREIVEFAERLKASQKIRRGEGKWLHRRICGSLLPGWLLDRKKRGFATNVVDSWFRSSESTGFSSQLRDGASLLFRHVDPDTVSGLLADHVSGRHDNYKILFSLVCFEEWLRANEDRLGG